MAKAPQTKTIKGGSGADVLRSTAAVENIYGNAGNDVIFGLPSDMRLDGGAGFDTLDLSLAEAGVRYAETGGLLRYWPQNAGTATAYNFERVVGSEHGDWLYAAGGADIVAGGGGGDSLGGGAGDDILIGDFIAAQDYAFAQPGVRGADVFEFSTSDGGRDRVLDFEYGVDHLFFYGVAQPTQFATQGEDLVVAWENGTITLVGLGWVTDYSQLTTLSHNGIVVG